MEELENIVAVVVFVVVVVVVAVVVVVVVVPNSTQSIKINSPNQSTMVLLFASCQGRIFKKFRACALSAYGSGNFGFFE